MNYYEHTCKCGCGGQIEIKEYHKWYGIPKFLKGHHRNKRNRFILKNKGKYFCQCGCNKEIEIKKHHLRYGIPKYISGHNTEIKIRNKCLYEKCDKLVTKPYNKYCSHKCYSLTLVGKSSWNEGKKWSEEHKEKLSKIHTGKILTEEHKQNIGKSLQGEKSHFYGVHLFGKLASNWQGGISFEPYTFEFNKELKNKIKQRDMYMCQTPNCMNTSLLDCHHIDYDKKNNSLDNFITLCRSCHAKTNGKNNRSYYTNYYQEILNVYL